MVTYSCKKCNKVFSHYGNYRNHMMRLFPCDGQKVIEPILELNDLPALIQKKTIEPIIDEPIIIPKKENDLICRYCNKVFSRKDVCKRHENKNCKMKPKNISPKTTIINNYQTVNNFQQNIQNNFYPEVGINPFGKEDISFLTNELMKKILQNPDSGIPRLIRLIHFNPHIPQNQNVRLKNKKEPYLNVFNGQNWELRDKDDTIQDLIISKKEIADDYFENLLTNQDIEITKKQDKIIDALQQKKYETYTEAIDEYLNSIILDNDQSKKMIMNKYKRLYDKLYKQINLIMMNNTQLANHLNGEPFNSLPDTDDN